MDMVCGTYENMTLFGLSPYDDVDSTKEKLNIQTANKIVVWVLIS